MSSVQLDIQIPALKDCICEINCACFKPFQVIIFGVTRAPFEVYELMKLFQQSAFGLKANVLWGTPYAAW